MTNDEIMALKTAAKDLAALPPNLVLDGEGRFLDLSTVGPREVPASEVLRIIAQYKKQADSLWAAVDAIPLITRSRKPAEPRLALEDMPQSGASLGA